MSAVFKNNNQFNISKSLSADLPEYLSKKLSKPLLKYQLPDDKNKISFYQNLNHKIHLWFSRSNQRKQLAKLDDRILMDIGYTREQVNIEIAKPFWK